MSIFDNAYRAIAQNLYELMTANNPLKQKREYYSGDQPKQIRVRPGKTDDNIIVNLVGLAVDRSLSHLLAGGVTFVLPEGEEAQDEYLSDLWECNRQSVLLYNAALMAAVYGTGYIKIIPDGTSDLYTGEILPRLVALNPEYLTIATDPQDAEKVLRYVVEYVVGDTGYREITRRTGSEDYEIPPETVDDTWVVENYITDKGGKWKLVDKYEWPYTFPPIVHWKNLPSINNVYGSSDIDDILGIQDKDNFTVSNIQKMVRLQAHRQLWGRNLGKDDLVDIGPDKLIKLTGTESELGVLDIQSDIGASLQFSRDLRQTLFDVAREVDITSITDKIGALTNFGLRVLYADSLSKTNTKRELFGEALLELNRRLLVLNGMEGEASRPGEIIWKDPLPVNIREEMETDNIALQMGIVDIQTIYERYAERYGQEWEEIQTRLMAAKQAQAGADLGTMLLRMREFNVGNTAQ